MSEEGLSDSFADSSGSEEVLKRADSRRKREGTADDDEEVNKNFASVFTAILGEKVRSHCSIAPSHHHC